MFKPSNDDQIRFPFPKIYSFAGVRFFVQKLFARRGEGAKSSHLYHLRCNIVYIFFHVLLLSSYILYIMITETSLTLHYWEHLTRVELMIFRVRFFVQKLFARRGRGGRGPNRATSTIYAAILCIYFFTYSCYHPIFFTL